MAGQFIGAVSTQDVEAGDRLMLSQIAEQVERGRISPMQIIQKQEQWIFNSDGGQKHPYRFIEPQARLLWWERITGCQLT